MDLQTYRLRRKEQEQDVHEPRYVCWTCRQTRFGCFCEEVQAFDPHIQFVILIHPIEVKRRIATGRMAHLCLKNSALIQGEDYTANQRVNDILASEDNQCVVLYPGRNSVNLSDLSVEQRSSLVHTKKNLVIFVIDGTWATARKTMRSANLKNLPRVCFTPTTPSRFRVRKQPAAEYHSTIEAIHQTIELFGPTKGFKLESRKHDNLLDVFDRLVEFQLQFI
ncbi:MAG TPA: tRNA-uridine aminocarboxypropyltransferase [Bdellovibrionales bacterium]|nr:tRNA-uridine aminocarboxypropyltransferase [Bdellovibrionales bacterium]